MVGTLKTDSKWFVNVFGHARDVENLTVLTFHWAISLRITSQKTEDSRHFHDAWGDVFVKMHTELGSSFCSVYGSRIRSDIFRAISQLTQPYNCVESIDADFTLNRTEPDEDVMDTKEQLKMIVRITEYTCDVRITEPYFQDKPVDLSHIDEVEPSQYEVGKAGMDIMENPDPPPTNMGKTYEQT